MTDVKRIIEQVFAENHVNNPSALQQAVILASAGLADHRILSMLSRSSRPLSTVRFRAMLQDTGYAKELYMPSNLGNSSVSPADMGDLRERWVGWAIEPPGLSPWFMPLAKQPVCPSADNAVTAAWLDNSPRAKFADPDTGHPHIGALVKIYDPSFQATPASVFDFTGILASSPMPANSTSDDEEPKMVATIHVLHHEPVPAAKVPASKRTRDELLDLLSQCFSPTDRTAAELLLCALVSNPTAHTGSTFPIGTLSLNLLRSEAHLTLERILRLIMPYVVKLDLSLPVLHQSDFVPTSSASDDLNAGLLQVPAGSLLLVDEDGMGEGGQLQEKAVKNLQYLSDVITQQKLPYEYPFAPGIKMDCAIRPLILSQGKSLLPTDVHVVTELAAEQPQVDEVSLQAYRAYLAVHGSLEHAAKIDIPEAVSQQIQATYVHERKKSAEKAANAEESLKTRLLIARLLAASEEEPVVTLGLWHRAVELHKEVTRRIEDRDADRLDRKLGMPSTNSATSH